MLAAVAVVVTAPGLLVVLAAAVLVVALTILELLVRQTPAAVAVVMGEAVLTAKMAVLAS